ncbi:MAG: M56 family metallopeptidase, partial [Planctomycetes bacterium]|nr:M56 family metallopeptidase [Planctomycetota bacterium]
MGSIEQQWLELVCQSLGWTLIHFLWQGGAVAVILAALMHLLKQASAQTRYGVAGMALLVMVVAPILTLTVMIDPATTEMPMPQTPSANLRETQSELPPAAPHIAGDPPFSSNVTVEQVDLAGALSRQGGMIETLETCLPWLVLLWLIGVLGLSIWHVGAWIQLQRFRRSVTDGVNASTKAMVDALAHRIGIRRSIRLCESARVCVPSVIGWLKPMILLPVSGLSGLSVEQMEAILAHELAHIRRHDYFVNLLQTAVEILGFYHPAVWWVSHTMRIERELCCDDIAVQATGHRRVYAEALAQL